MADDLTSPSCRLDAAAAENVPREIAIAGELQAELKGRDEPPAASTSGWKNGVPAPFSSAPMASVSRARDQLHQALRPSVRLVGPRNFV